MVHFHLISGPEGMNYQSALRCNAASDTSDDVDCTALLRATILRLKVQHEGSRNKDIPLTSLATRFLKI